MFQIGLLALHVSGPLVRLTTIPLEIVPQHDSRFRALLQVAVLEAVSPRGSVCNSGLPCGQFVKHVLNANWRQWPIEVCRVNSGSDIVSGGTDTHLLLADLRPKNLTGKAAEESLERAGMTCNKNAIPFDPQRPSVTSGIRLGSPAATSRGFGGEEFRQIGVWIAEVLEGLAENPKNNETVEQKIRDQVVALCQRYPIYPDLAGRI